MQEGNRRMNFELIAPCHFGLESVLKNEIYDLGYEITSVEDGRVTFAGDEEAVVLSNLHLRTAERILLKVGSFHAESFEDLFQGTMALPWEEYLPSDARFWVTKAASVKSRLFSPSDIQSVMKKAMVERMKQRWHTQRFPENGASYPVRVFLKKDEVSVALDTSGDSLHKRGYRRTPVKAPIAENLAAALLMLTPWKPDRILVDPFCGSGTFLIEAAMIAANIAPGLKRQFTAQSWTNLIPKDLWGDLKSDAQSAIVLPSSCDIQGYDIDPAAIRAARENAKLAGVDSLIHFQARDVKDLSHSGKYGFIVTNPPYGQRLTDDEHGGDIYPTAVHPKQERQENAGADDEIISALYKTLGDRMRLLDTWSLYLITSYPGVEKLIGKKAAKKRKVYNGMIQTCYYTFPGPKPSGSSRPTKE